MLVTVVIDGKFTLKNGFAMLLKIIELGKYTGNSAF
jgi:hypothetical protein